MTCAHVLGLIDAGAVASYPRAHVDRAWAHARTCPTCGPAMSAAAALTADLAALPQPAPPPELTAAVLARVAEAEHTQPDRVGLAMATTPSGTVPRDRAAWAATALGGLLTGLVIALSMVSDGGARIGTTSSGAGPMMGVAMPSTLTDALVLGTGLLLYAAGLFAPLAVHRRS